MNLLGVESAEKARMNEGHEIHAERHLPLFNIEPTKQYNIVNIGFGACIEFYVLRDRKIYRVSQFDVARPPNSIHRNRNRNRNSRLFNERKVARKAAMGKTCDTMLRLNFLEHDVIVLATESMYEDFVKMLRYYPFGSNTIIWIKTSYDGRGGLQEAFKIKFSHTETVELDGKPATLYHWKVPQPTETTTDVKSNTV